MNNLALRSAWVARPAAITFALFISLFALDAVEEDGGTWKQLGHVAWHLVPTALCVFVIVLAWSRPWIGTLGFAALAVCYAYMAWGHPSWIIIIGGPLLFIAALYALQAYASQAR